MIGPLFALLLASAQPTSQHPFCGESPFIPFEDLLGLDSTYLGKRIKTRGILRVGGKEYVLITATDKSKRGILLSSDRQSEVYASTNFLYSSRGVSFVDDCLSLLRGSKGARTPLDRTYISNYRQRVLLCGRIEKEKAGIVFELDDSVRENSYILSHQKH